MIIASCARRSGHIVAWAALAMLWGAASAQDSRRISFSLPAQDATDSIPEFARQAGIQISAPAERLKGMRTPETKGELTTVEALSRLLEGSGLTFEYIDAKTIVIRVAPRTVQVLEAQSTRPSGRLAALDEPTQRVGHEKAPVSPGRGTLFGHVADAISNGSLPGALVRIHETGDTAVTDEQGNFRFREVPNGQYSLSISYLGYAEKVWPVFIDGPTSQTQQFALEKPAQDLGEVTVFGARSARALALNQQRTAENNAEVLSADQLGDFTGTTISEALRRVSGVSFMRDDKTGDGTNIIIRGLEPDMNAIKLNGLSLPVGNGIGRSASLNNFLADSVSKITIHKTLLPSMDSAGTGGLVEIETKSPLERPARYLNFSVEGGRRGGDFSKDALLSGTVSQRLGAEQAFGLSASVQYRKQDNRTAGYSIPLLYGEYLPLGPGGQPNLDASDLDPFLNFPFASGSDGVYIEQSSIGADHTDRRTLSVTLSGEWQPAQHTNLKLDIQRAEVRGSSFSSNGGVILQSPYSLREVAALGGEMRQALTYGYQANAAQGFVTLDGQRNVTDTYSFRGVTEEGSWHLNYGLGFARGADNGGDRNEASLIFKTGPNYSQQLDPSFFLAQAFDPVEGLIITPFAPRAGDGLPLPLFSKAAWSFFNNPDNYYFSGGQGSTGRGSNELYSGQASGRYDINWRALKYLETGVQFERSNAASSKSFRAYRPNSKIVFLPDPPYFDEIPPSAAPLGLKFTSTGLTSVIPSGQGFHYLSESSARGFIANLQNFADADDPVLFVDNVPRNALEDQELEQETATAGYLQGRFELGRLEIIGGARLNRVKVRSVTLSGPELIDENFNDDLQFAAEFARLIDESAVQTDVLPRVLANYRQTDNLIFRAGYYLTTARPSIRQLSDDEYIQLIQAPFFGPNRNQQLLTISRGNPGLKPAVTNNFDLDMEYYDQNIGVIRIGGFYKRIANSLQSNATRGIENIGDIALPDHPAFRNLDFDEIYVTATRPENANFIVKIWGLEANLERQFNFLPGAWSGFGMFANYSYSKSSSQQEHQWNAPVFDENGEIVGHEERVRTLRGVPFNFQPRYSATFALTYNRYGLDATLVYGIQDRYQTGNTPNNLDDFSEGVRTLDLRVAHNFKWGGSQLQLSLEGADLLKGIRDPDLQSSTGAGSIGRYFTSATYLGGRQLRLGVSATF